MSRGVRWADLGLDDAAAAAPDQPAAAAADEDAWGPDDAPLQEDQPTRPVFQGQQHVLAALLAAADRQQRAPAPQQRTKPLYKQQQAAATQPARTPQQQQPRPRHQVPTLTRMCMTVLALHVTALVEQLGEQVQWLPADMRAVLLAVARWVQ